MSDPAKSPEEIEDVLASIRRLVSDHSAIHSRNGTAQQGVRPVPDLAAKEAEKLVLTPSFRVSDPDAVQDPVVLAPAALENDVQDPDTDETEADETEALVAGIVTAGSQADDEDDTNGSGTDWRRDDRMAKFDTVGAAVSDRADEDDEDERLADHGAFDLPDEDAAAADAVQDLARLDGVDVASGDFESDTGDENWPGDGAEAALLKLVARRDPGAETGTAPQGAARAVDEVPQDSMEEDEFPEAETVDPQEESAEAEAPAEDDDTESRDHADDHAGPEDHGQAELEDDTEEEQVMADHAAADEPAADDTGNAHHGGDPDTPAAPLFSRRAQAARSPEADEPEAPSPEAEAFDIEDLGDDAAPFDFPDDEESVLDEDTLREIIVDVVREELQGVLGQRITRNVRKMVRREVRLALAAEDLE